MPYDIVNKAGGYKVCLKSDHNKCLSNKVHKTLQKAQSQLVAVLMNEKKRKYNKKKPKKK
jgi:hypothetical protein